MEDLSAVADETEAAQPEGVAAAIPVEMAEMCGYFHLEEARAARRVLREHQIRSEIVIRDCPDPDRDEEYWLRVERSGIRAADRLLHEIESGSATAGDSVACSKCGEVVSAAESFCPKCGTRFEEG
ncbi:MAG: hypothetical protein GY716_19460 [bacterium]|nr:hypothetical protein [bacterium]